MSSSWFKRIKKGITTPTKEKKETPDGLWFKSPKGHVVETSELKKIITSFPLMITTNALGRKNIFKFYSIKQNMMN